MIKNDWAEVSKLHPDLVMDLQLVTRFLGLVDLAVATRATRLQKALGTQHFLFLGQMEGLLQLAKSANWIAIPAIASALFHIALEGTYLARNPSCLNEFVSFSWYETNCISRIEVQKQFHLDSLEEMRRDREALCEKIRSNYCDRTTWHGHTVDGLAAAVGMSGLLPLYRYAIRTCNGNPTGLMFRSKAGRFIFDQCREKYLPAMVSWDSLLLACCSTFYFYDAIVKAFGISNEIILKSLDDIYIALDKHNP